MKNPVSMTKLPLKTTYETWMESEGVPIVEAEAGIEDLTRVERQSWPRAGGAGAFIYLKGMKESGLTGMYVMEIPPRGRLEPEKHLYEETIYILDGEGATEIWQEGKPRRTFEWTKGSLFSPPLNATHCLYNVSNRPAIFVAVTNAPLVMDLFHSPEFVFGDTFAFEDRYSGEEDYFKLNRQVERNPGEHLVWETNFIADLKNFAVDARERLKGKGVRIIGFEMSENILTGHISEWPVALYHKAHYHAGGAILLGLCSEGYVLLWPKELGTTPYRNGHGDKVIKIKWKEGSVYCPPTDWFHQHFNTGSVPARHIAFRTDGAKYRLGLPIRFTGEALMKSLREGGTIIDYEDEDPQIRKDFETAISHPVLF
jgi:quercetin dioxygenase-like cupin family protein